VIGSAFIVSREREQFPLRIWEATLAGGLAKPARSSQLCRPLVLEPLVVIFGELPPCRRVNVCATIAPPACYLINRTPAPPPAGLAGRLVVLG
jgi:hypothetical protein